MPIYGYECQACQHRLEVKQSMKDAALTKCPACGKKKLARLITGGYGYIPPVKTVGSIAERNARDMRRSGLMPEGKKKKPPPWWRSRKDGKIDYSVLKDPKKYVATGEK